MAGLGAKLVSSLLKANDVSQFLELDFDDGELLESELPPYLFIKNHVRQYGALPAKKTLEDYGLGLTFVEAHEPAAYYVDKIHERFIYRELVRTMNSVKPLLDKDSEGFSPEEALVRVQHDIAALAYHKDKTDVVDFRHSGEMLKQEYMKKYMDLGDEGLQLGWPSLDMMSGGLYAGDVVSIVGRPAMGKTFSLLWSMRHAWWEQKKATMLVSMEMLPLPICQRFAAMHIGRSLTRLKNAEYSTEDRELLFNELTAVGDYQSPAWIVNGNLASTVEDIWSLATTLNPEVILIDGAYLVKHPNQRIGKYDRVSENAELIKSQLATDLKVPVIASYQFNRDATKKAKNNKAHDIGLEDIGLTDSIGQLSSLVCGLLEEDNVETLAERVVTILKGRNGEMGRFNIRWDFMRMNFGEIPDNLEEMEVS